MVNDSGQLYTMEGVAAGLVMIITAYFVLNTTSIYTPGDTHITDMQLEQLASDALAMMDTPEAEGAESPLHSFVRLNDGAGFRTMFLDCCKLRAGGIDDNLHMNATIFYCDRSHDEIKSYSFGLSDVATGRESAVRVSRWVQLNTRPSGAPGTVSNQYPVLLVEVLVWRG
ncbi:hypothetical protein ABH15_05230 [Methanoculleus taiwanensis]|uniref:Uncharacterized protein n=1 Tax=Methanoculleus taiwanensis TaxID=1550565 RepID=A0A498GY45_9EURY|nr:hypothetical protein [Methanoculleus taiwanensis]RXE55651.1 hypothetical protein ABH15_05230 [Methanoculleus taiwanensis]